MRHVQFRGILPGIVLLEKLVKEIHHRGQKIVTERIPHWKQQQGNFENYGSKEPTDKSTHAMGNIQVMIVNCKSFWFTTHAVKSKKLTVPPTFQ